MTSTDLTHESAESALRHHLAATEAPTAPNPVDELVARMTRPSPVTLDKDAGTIDIVTSMGNYTCSIPLSSVRTHRDIVAWILHLSSKRWFTRDMCARFILTAIHANGFEYPQC